MSETNRKYTKIFYTIIIVIILTEEEVKPGKRSRGSSLEEGEVSDEAERRPEESEPKPVCRFFSRGACTWGVSCR